MVTGSAVLLTRPVGVADVESVPAEPGGKTGKIWKGGGPGGSEKEKREGGGIASEHGCCFSAAKCSLTVHRGIKSDEGMRDHSAPALIELFLRGKETLYIMNNRKLKQ